MTTRRLAIMLGLAACIPMLARAQNPPTKPAPLLFWRTSGDSTAACGRYSAFYRGIPPKPALAIHAGVAPINEFKAALIPKHGDFPPVTSFEQALFAPELIMLRQDALALTAEQRKTITETLKTLEAETVDLQWKVQGEQAKLIELLEQRPLKEGDAAAQMARLLDAEAAVKTKHFLSLVRIKNTLTDTQVQQMNVLQRCGAAR